MIDLTRHPRTLKFLSLVYLARRQLARRLNGAGAALEHRAAFYESAWRDAAEWLGARVEHLGDDILELTRGDARVRVAKNHSPLDDHVTLTVAGSKPVVYRLLADRSIAVPRHLEFTLTTITDAVKFRRTIGGACVVKPARDTGAGQGVTTGVTDAARLAHAAAHAATYGEGLIIEEQIAGDNYRLLYLDGELIDAVVRRPPQVVGDGRSTVAQLVREANRRRLASGANTAQVVISMDLDMRHTLRRQGLTTSSTPAAGRRVKLKTVINDNAGAENESAARLLCRSILSDGARAAAAVGARLAGVDIITTDPSVPLAESGGVVLEVNTTPGFYYHYHKHDGPFPVARHVLRAALAGRGQRELEQDLATERLPVALEETCS
jgi:cyanophycin synthetase